MAEGKAVAEAEEDKIVLGEISGRPFFRFIILERGFQFEENDIKLRYKLGLKNKLLCLNQKLYSLAVF